MILGTKPIHNLIFKEFSKKILLLYSRFNQAVSILAYIVKLLQS